MNFIHKLIFFFISLSSDIPANAIITDSGSIVTTDTNIDITTG